MDAFDLVPIPHPLTDTTGGKTAERKRCKSARAESAWRCTCHEVRLSRRAPRSEHGPAKRHLGENRIGGVFDYRRGCAARPATPVRRRACRPLRPGSGSCRPVRQFLREFERLRAVVLLPGALRGRFHGSNHMPTKADREISLQNAGSRRFGDGFRYDWFHGNPRLVTSLVASPKVRLPAGSQSR